MILYIKNKIDTAINCLIVAVGLIAFAVLLLVDESGREAIKQAEEEIANG